MKRFSKGYKLKVFLIGLFSFFMGCFEFLGLAIIFPFILLLSGDKNVLNFPMVKSILSPFLSNPNDYSEVKTTAFILCGIIIVIYILKDIFMILCTKYQNEIMADWLFDIYSKTLKNLVNCPYTKINKLSYGDKSALLGSALTSSVSCFVHKTIFLMSNLIIALCILTFLFYKFTTSTVVAAAFLGTFAFLENLVFKRIAKKYGKKLLEAQKKAGGLFEYTMKGLKEIKVSKNKDYFIEKLTENYRNTSQCIKVLDTNGTYPVYVTEIGIIITFGIIVAIVFHFEQTAPKFLISYLAVVAAVILRLVPILNKIQSSMYTVNQSRNPIKWFLETSKKIEDWAEEEPQCEDIPFNNTICLQNAGFIYDKETDGAFSLHNINLEIKKGEFIGIVGPSGSGKTTLLDMLSGLNSLSEGKFLIDGIEITKNNVRAWHRHISILPQDFFLMPRSILENVTFGQKENEIDNEKIIEALKKAEIYDKIDDINSTAGLSHGQNHRIALARAFYQNADILFLDEATSSLDIETEDKVSKSISKLKGEKTIIAIAHRLSTLKECDSLLYMKDGKIIDKGTFKELKEKYPDFENMLKLSTFKI